MRRPKKLVARSSVPRARFVYTKAQLGAEMLLLEPATAGLLSSQLELIVLVLLSAVNVVSLHCDFVTGQFVGLGILERVLINANMSPIVTT